MNVRCPHCQSIFRVDPARVPAAGIKARCSRCSNVFMLARDGSVQVPAPAPAPAPVAAPQPAPPPRPTPPAAPAAPAATATSTAPAIRPIPTTLPPMAPAATPAPVAAAPAAAPARRASFRNQDPAARAARLARALVSDIVAYNKDKVKQTSGAAALRSEFREEIRKSWEEYVEQVGLETAKGTPYFRDALNDILAKGEKVF